MAGFAWAPGTAAWIAAASVLLPLVLGLAALWRATAPAALRLGPWAAVPALLLAAGYRDPWVIDVPWLLLGTRIGLDVIGYAFLLLAALVWLSAGMAARTTSQSGPPRGRFFAFFLLSMSGSLGLPLVRDAASFYVCFALMSLSAYGLVAHRNDGEARRAGRAYIAFAIVGELLLVSGLFFAVWTAGTASLDELPARMLSTPKGLAAVPLILLGCGIKAGAVPLHPWLPVSYAAAPVPATVAMAGAMSKAGVLGWLRLLPLGHASLVEWSVPMALLGIVAAFYGVAAGLCQRDAKTALAYSSVSQMGFLSATVGLGMIVPAGWALMLPAVLVYSIHHGLAKSALFLTIAVPQPDVASRALRTAAIVVTAALGLSLAGMTMTSGAAAKVLLKEAIIGSGAPSADGIVFALSLAAVGTTLLMARVVWLLAEGSTTTGRAVRPADERTERPPMVAWVAAAVVSFSAPWTVMRTLTDPSQTWSASGLPYILAGAGAAAAVAWRASTHNWRWVPAVPAGDILVALEWVAARVWALAAAKPAPHAHEHDIAEGAARVSAPEAAIPMLERSLLRWPVYGLVVLVLFAAVAAALALGAG